MNASEWLKEIEKSSKHEKEWRQSAREVIKIYRDDDDEPVPFNILWSNTQTLKPAIYSHTPRPDVRRRFLDEDKVALQATEVLNRSLSFAIDAYDFDEMMDSVILDVLLPGRGIARAKYVPTFEEIEERIPVEPEAIYEGDTEAYPEGTQFDEEGAFRIEKTESLVDEEVVCEYVYWEDFRMSKSRCWDDVKWVAFGSWMTEDEIADEFGVKASKNVPIGEMEHIDPKDRADRDKEARIWQIWDKDSRKVLTVAEGYDEFLDKQDDPLGLEQFFPCPKPLYSFETTDTMIPRPEYAIYQEQAEELNTITERISALTNALRRRGVYDASMPALKQLADAGDNEFIPITDYATKVMEKGGIAALMAEAPIDKIAQVVIGLYQQRAEIKQIIFEITGLSDIQRGSTKASETLGAQQIKAQFGSLRIEPRQKAVQRFARDLLRLKAEIMAENFSQGTIELMTGLPLSDEAFRLLRTDKARGFRIDIETDSTIAPDIATEQKNRIDFLTAVTGFVQQIAPLVQAGALPPETAKQLFMFAVRSFKIPPALEEAVERIGGQDSQQQQMQAQVAQAQQMLAQREQQAKEAEEQARRQIDDARVAKANLQVEEQKLMRQRDALKAQEKILSALAEIKGLELTESVRDAVEEIADLDEESRDDTD